MSDCNLQALLGGDDELNELLGDYPPVSQQVISNISDDQTEILHNIGLLHNNGSDQFDADMTASSLGFYGKLKRYKYCIPEPHILMDVAPTADGIIQIHPFNKLPLADESIHSIVCDLPFVIAPKTSKSVLEGAEGSNLIFNRFSSFYPHIELLENIYWWVGECYRVLGDGGICIWKMQSTVSGGRQVWSVPFSFLCATDVGFYVIDEFILQAKVRLISSKVKNQQHARKYTSTFWVFKKDGNKAVKNNCLTWLQECKNNVYEGKVFELK